MSTMFNPVKKSRVSDEIRHQIIQMLSNGQLRVGDQLPSEGTLARQMGVSQVPVREAVLSLEQFGLLVVKRGSGGGVFVAEPSLEPFSKYFSLLINMGQASIQEVTAARLLVEPGVAALAAQNAQPSHLTDLQKAVEEYEQVVNQNRARTIKDMDFHIILAEAANNQVLEMILKALVPILFRTVHEHRFSKADRLRGISEHHMILDAVLAGDPQAASQAMSEHVQRMATYWK